MRVDCSSVVAYGHILTEEEYYLLEEKFGEYLYEKILGYSAECDYYAFVKWW